MASNKSYMILASSVVLSSLLLAVVPALVSSSARAGASHSAEDDKEAADEESTEDKKGDEKFEIKREYFSPSSGTWQEVEASDKEARELVFIVKHRTYPKSKEYVDQEDYSAIEILSKQLVNVLRDELREVEEIFADEPSIDSRDLFHHLKDLEALREDLKKKVEAAKEAEATEEKSTEKSDEGGKEETKEVTKEEEDKPKVNGATKADDQDDEVEGEQPKVTVTADELSTQLEHLSILLDWLLDFFAPVRRKLDRLLETDQITFSLLWSIFPYDSYVETIHENTGERMAFRLKSTIYTASQDGPVFSLTGTKITWNGTRYVRVWVYVDIPKYKGMRKLSALSTHPLPRTSEQFEKLTERGRAYVKLAGVHYVHYAGVLVQVQGHGMNKKVVKMRAEGRAVIDVKSFRRMNPSHEAIWDDDYEDDEDTGSNGYSLASGVAEEELCLLPPSIYGFSMVQREWGEMRVDQFSPLVFRPESFEHLVLDPAYKDLMHSLVQQCSKSSTGRAAESTGEEGSKPGSVMVTDVVSGKGGGLVLCLHGRPGVGKTLTAEAISELLKVPLYMIGAGELGVQADQLERRLRDVLDVVQAWGGVLLIDEADVFLEERSLHDVARNAMVSVFLRLLEYHSGILILTTNRIRTVDPAFLSRFSLALTYPDLSAEKRKTIWASFLKLAGAGVEEVSHKKRLANGTPNGEVTKVTVSYEFLDNLASKSAFNGRSIKNCVRTAQALAISKGEQLGESHLKTVVKVCEKFEGEMKQDEETVYDAPGEGWKDRLSVYN